MKLLLKELEDLKAKEFICSYSGKNGYIEIQTDDVSDVSNMIREFNKDNYISGDPADNEYLKIIVKSKDKGNFIVKYFRNGTYVFNFYQERRKRAF